MTTVEEKERNQSALLADKNNDHDLVNELSKRLDAACEYGERIANAEDDPELQAIWRDLEHQEQDNIRRLKEVIIDRIDKGVFLNDL